LFFLVDYVIRTKILRQISEIDVSFLLQMSKSVIKYPFFIQKKLSEMKRSHMQNSEFEAKKRKPSKCGPWFITRFNVPVKQIIYMDGSSFSAIKILSFFNAF